VFASYVIVEPRCRFCGLRAAFCMALDTLNARLWYCGARRYYGGRRYRCKFTSAKLVFASEEDSWVTHASSAAFHLNELDNLL
jgi:hypothetical protein